MGAISQIELSLKTIKKEIKKIEVLLEYKQKKRLINKIMDIKYSEQSEQESEEESEEDSDMESQISDVSDITDISGEEED
jgi:hypothetical protein